MFGDNEEQTKDRSEDLNQQPAPQQAPDTGITKALRVAFVMLVVALAALTGYGYHTLKKHNIQLHQVPAMLQSEAVLSGHLQVVEAKVQDWTSKWNDLKEQIRRVDQRAASGVRDARKHAEDLTVQATEQLQAQIDAQQYLADNRFKSLESGQESEKTRVAQLESELASMREELAAYREHSNLEFTSLERRVDGNDHSLASLAQWIPQDRIGFEASRHRATELLPGMSMTVTRTDVRHQRFKGWVVLSPEGRTLWVERQGILQPMVFYRQQDGGRCELVVTHVTEDSVVGYLLVPAGTTASRPMAQLEAPASGGR